MYVRVACLSVQKEGQVLDICSAVLALHKGTDVYCLQCTPERRDILSFFWHFLSAPEDGDFVAVLQLGQHRPQLLVVLLRDVHRQVHHRLVDALGS